MDPFLIPQVIDLAGENPAKTYRQPLASGDSAAHRWEVRVVRAGAAADLTGCSAAVLARREGEDSSPTVRQRADIAGNVASAEFIPEVYALGGRLLAVMVISDASGRVVTSAALRMQGKRYTTDSISDPEGTIPSLDALLARYNDLLSATEAANAATADARAATEETQAALGDAQQAVAQAQAAVEDAQGALITAQTAADTAGAAAGKIDNMTVSATPVSTGTATAELSTVDGHYHLALGLPKGDTGATPQISVQVATGAAGSEAQVSVSGTAENPVIHLTIPRGDTGRIENLTINGKPVESGTITLTAADLGAASAKEVSQLKSDKLDKTATAADSSKLGGVAASDYALKTDTAPDSSKLGGKAPEYYIQPRNLLDNSDFTNLVAQAGIGGYHGAVAYASDRWILDSGTVSYAEGTGLTLNGTIRQKLEFPPTGQTSAFVGTVTGAASISYADGAVTITSSGGVIKWAALYEGSYTAETLPPYVPKGYNAELLACMYYYQELVATSTYSALGWAIGYSSTSLKTLIHLKAPIRKEVNPTITYSGAWEAYQAGFTKLITDFTNDQTGCGIVRLNGVTDGDITVNSFYMVRARKNKGAKICISMDL